MLDTAHLITLWEKLSKYPGGKFLFIKILGHFAPYTGSLGVRLDVLNAEVCRCSLKDRRAVRNHLDCVHALALGNFGEFTSGMAAIKGSPPGMRAILTHFEISYLKKSRGLLTSEARVPRVPPGEKSTQKIVVEIKNATGEVTAVATASWLVSPSKPK